jgi:Skp family chaperone for outer membrane proteins
LIQPAGIFCWHRQKFLLSSLPMKNLRLAVFAVLIIAVGTLSAAAQNKVASVDMKKLFNGYWKTKQAQAALENRKTELAKEIKDMANGLEKAQTDYKSLLDQANDQAISADERDKRKSAAADKAKEINASKAAIEQFQRQAEAQLTDQSQRMSGNLVSEIQKAVTDKAKAGNYSLVVNAASVEAVVYVSADNDLTSAVLGQLNAGAPIDVSTPASGLPLSISTNAP